MKILLIDSKSYGISEIVQAMEELGWQTKILTKHITDRKVDEELEQMVSSCLEAEAYDFLFTFNYYPAAAEICHRKNLRYVSWVYDSPLVALYSYTMIYETNTVLVFDYMQYRELHDKGLTCVYYMPLASNMLNRELSMSERTMQVSFVGSLYNNEKNNLFQKFAAASEYVQGYLDSLVEIQRKMPEAYVLREGLTPEIVKELQNCCPYEENNHEGVEKASDVYADYFLARRVTALERMEALKKLSEKQEVWLFSDCEELSLTEVRQMGRVDYYNQMPQVFEASKINLNITLRSIQTGIPLRVLDIMGCRGFLITNYQQEMEEYFTRGIHYEDYRSIEELEEKTAYYLRHDVERERIAEHGYERVKEEFCYRKRLQQIEKIVRG